MMYNNLSTAGQIHAFASQTEIVLVRPLGPHKLPQKESDKAPLTHVAVQFARGRTIVAATSNIVTTLIDATKEMPLACIQHGPDAESRGAAMVEIGDRLFVAVGHGTGEVTLAEIGPDFSANVFSKVKAHHASVSAVATNASSPAMIVTGDVNGALQFWNNQFQPFVSVPIPGECVTSIAIFGAFVCASYGSGTIRLFLAQTGELRIEVAAHSKWINAIGYSPVTNVLASVSDDSLLCLWRMPTVEDPRLHHIGHRLLTNQLLTGVSFSDDGKTVFVAPFDVDKLHAIAVPV